MKTTNHRLPYLWLLPVLLLVTACTKGPEDQFIELAKCYKASKLVDDAVLRAAADAELVVITSEMENKQIKPPSLFAMRINEKVNDELYPAGSSTNSDYVIDKALSWVNSSYCQSLRKKASTPPVKTPSPPPEPALISAPEPTPTSNLKVVPLIDGNCEDPAGVIKAAGLVPKLMQIHGPIDRDAAGIGCAYRQDPPPGTAVQPGSEVTYRAWWES